MKCKIAEEQDIIIKWLYVYIDKIESCLNFGKRSMNHSDKVPGLGISTIIPYA